MEFHALVAKMHRENVFMLLCSRELNIDKVGFCSFVATTKYCNLFLHDIKHLYGPAVVQSRAIFVCDAITHTVNE